MTRARFFLALSWLALVIGLAAVFVSSTPGGGQWMDWFMVDHGLVLINIFVATSTLRRARRSAVPYRWPGLRRLFAPWLIATGCVAAAAMLALQVAAPVDLALPQGHHLQLVAHDFGSMQDHRHSQDPDETFSVFAHVWVLFAFVGLCLWHIVALRAEQARDPEPQAEPALATAISPRERADADDRWAAWRLPLIVAIWAVAIAWSFVAMRIVPAREMCGAPLPWQFALLPPVFFGISGLFSRRAPYNAPWLAEIVDSRYGSGAWVRFLVSLKPILLIATCALCFAWSARQSCGGTGGVDPPFMSLFFASGALGFVLMHLALRARRIDGV